MDIQTVSTALAATVAGLGLHQYDYGPDAPVSPAVFIYLHNIPDYQATFDGMASADFILRFLISSVAAQGGQKQLNDLISPTGTGSAVALIHADNTLGGLVSSLRISEMRDYGVLSLPDGATRYYSAELIVEVYA